MLRVGLTGGVACGKSTVGAMLERRGVHLIQADHVARQLMEPGQQVYDEVVKQFGCEIVKPDGSIDRPRLALAAFGAGRVEELNRIVHPAVIARQEEWMSQIFAADPAAIAVVEAALIFEAGIARRFDRVLVVTCTAEQKIERFIRRVIAADPQIDPAAARGEASRRIAAQLPDEEKTRLADFVIDNSGDLSATERRVAEIFAALLQESRAQAASPDPSHRPASGVREHTP